MDNTREKLIEVKNALEMCYKQGLTSECTGCTYREHNNVCMDALMEDALAVIKCLEEKQATSNESKWIPVTERLPDTQEYDWVLAQVAFIPGNLYGVPVVAELRHGEWYDAYDETIEGDFEKVTHWMPLPEPPKEG